MNSGSNLTAEHSGGLIAKHSGQPAPLTGIKIKGVIKDFLSTTKISQYFNNGEANNIEAEYTFAIPENGAIQSLEVKKMDGQLITAKIEDRETAAEKYED